MLRLHTIRRAHGEMQRQREVFSMCLVVSIVFSVSLCPRSLLPLLNSSNYKVNYTCAINSTVKLLQITSISTPTSLQQSASNRIVRFALLGTFSPTINLQLSHLVTFGDRITRQNLPKLQYSLILMKRI